MYCSFYRQQTQFDHIAISLVLLLIIFPAANQLNVLLACTLYRYLFSFHYYEINSVIHWWATNTNWSRGCAPLPRKVSVHYWWLFWDSFSAKYHKLSRLASLAGEGRRWEIGVMHPSRKVFLDPSLLHHMPYLLNLYSSTVEDLLWDLWILNHMVLFQTVYVEIEICVYVDVFLAMSTVT